MIGSFKRRASRIGLINQKALVNIDIVELSLQNNSPINDGSVLSICFERGGKISCTSNVTFSKDTLENNNPLQKKIVLKSTVVPIYETVALVATLYKEGKTGIFQEKTGKIILRQLRKSKSKNTETFKGLGIYDLPIHDLVNELEMTNKNNNTNQTTMTKEQTLIFDLLQNTSLKVIITIELLQENDSFLADDPEHNQEQKLFNTISTDNLMDLQTPTHLLTDHDYPNNNYPNNLSPNDLLPTLLGATFDNTPLTPLQHINSPQGLTNSNLVNSNIKRRKSRMSFMMTPNSTLNIDENGNKIDDLQAFINQTDNINDNTVETPTTPNNHTRTASTDRKKHILSNKSTPRENNKITSHSLSGLFNSPDIEEKSTFVSEKSSSAPEKSTFSDENSDLENDSDTDSIIVDVDNIRNSILNRNEIELYSNTLKNSGSPKNQPHSSSQSESVIHLDFNEIDLSQINYKDLVDETVQVVEVLRSPKSTRSTHNSPVPRHKHTDAYTKNEVNEVDKEVDKEVEEEEGNKYDETESVAESATTDTSVNGQSLRKSKLRVRKVTANKEAFRLYNKELVSKTKRVERLEREMAEQAATHSTALLALHEKLKTSELENCTLKDIINQTAAMHEAANRAAEALENEKIAKEKEERVQADAIALLAKQLEAAQLEAYQQAELERVQLILESTVGSIDDGSPETEIAAVMSVDRANSEVIIDDSTAPTESNPIAIPTHTDRTSMSETGDQSPRTSRFAFGPEWQQSVGGMATSLGAEEYLRRASVIHASVDSGSLETISFADFARMSAELSTIREEVTRLKTSLQAALLDKAEETQAAREAATEAVRANMRRADLQQENEEILEDLIDMKIKFANLSIDVDAQLLLNSSLQRRIQVYAEKLTRLEVVHTNRQSLSVFDTPGFRNSAAGRSRNNSTLSAKNSPHKTNNNSRHDSTGGGGSNK